MTTIVTLTMNPALDIATYDGSRRADPQAALLGAAL